ncbi:hypothetical protein SPBR_03384 [Sporothrix brasiliensis 5110]|uniref:Uncharacterized protein n=1 Tax=Sporothrix brasiliensis 5110 TaxID=1398154 RepID=A0A0C2J834_9PEZI|nr:uncharacterized protein SPBR_03384 [Sporothrix brasiliensis 5110]KIH93142.1 hypothetical protein SPBR_03384 [Sporothrix brasiliensis 5110]
MHFVSKETTPGQSVVDNQIDPIRRSDLLTKSKASINALDQLSPKRETNDPLARHGGIGIGREDDHSRFLDCASLR